MNAKLTAYALNELPPDERAALEAEMETNPALRAEAEEMRKFCAVIHDQVSASDKVALTVEQRVRVLCEFTSEAQPKKAARPIWRHPAFLVPTAIAACTTALLVINLNQGRPPTPREMEQMVEQRLAERTPHGTSSEDIRVTMEKAEGAARSEGQTPAPGKPELPALVAANSTLSLNGGAQTLPSMPGSGSVAPAAPSMALPQSLEGTISSTTPGGMEGKQMLAVNDPAASPMPNIADTRFGSVSGDTRLGRSMQPAARGIELDAARPLERYSFLPEKLGESPAEIMLQISTSPQAVDNHDWLESRLLPPGSLTLVSPPADAGEVPSLGTTAFSVDQPSLLGNVPASAGTEVFSPGLALGIFGAGILPDGDSSDNARGGLDINGGTSIMGTGAVNLTGDNVPILGDIPIAGRAFQGTGGIAKTGEGSLVLSSAQGNAPTAGEPVANFARGANVATSSTTTISSGTIAVPAETTANDNITFTNGSGVVASSPGRAKMLNEVNRGWEDPIALQQASANSSTGDASKLTVAGGVMMETPVDVAGVTASPAAPASMPVETKPASGPDTLSRTSTLATVTDNMAGAPMAPAPAAAPAAATPPLLAATTPAPIIAGQPAADPYFALTESKKPFLGESLAPTEQELEKLRTLQEGLDLRLKQLKDSEERARRLTTRNPSGETYTPIYENPFLQVAQQPLSTFSIDVDTASYANVRRFLNNGQRPPADAVRLEELINYFPYTYEPPAEDGAPFSVTVDMAEAPWQPAHRLARIALKGREIRQERGAANFVFLVDVSGSMDQPDKLPLVKQSLRMLTEQIKDTDRVAIVTYAGKSGVALTSTSGSKRKKIQSAINALDAGGSTNGAGGIRMAYQQAAENFIQEGVNRVILCTDGDFNVGISSPEELEKLIAEKAKSRVFLSVLGYGTGNLKDRTMETLADKGNGNYAYIDSLSEARKVLVDQMNATLVTIAKDVKIQVEFNPSQVAAYRLLGYENRALAKEDFNNDRKDAGEIGAGHTVTALYEIVPAGARLTSPDGRPMVDNLKYAPKPAAPAAPAAAAEPAPGGGSPSKETMTVKLRYKQPEGDRSQLIEVPVTDKEQTMANAPRDFVFAAGVTGFGMLLRNSQYSGELTWDMVRDMAMRGKGEDPLGYRGEFLQLIDKARGLTEGRE